MASGHAEGAELALVPNGRTCFFIDIAEGY
jgi:hypothetical protein